MLVLGVLELSMQLGGSNLEVQSTDFRLGRGEPLARTGYFCLRLAQVLAEARNLIPRMGEFVAHGRQFDFAARDLRSQ